VAALCRLRFEERVSVPITDQDVELANRRMEEEREGGYALVARYDPGSARVVIEMSTGLEVSVAADLLEGLAGAAPTDLADIEVCASGLGLHWPRLDADFWLPALLRGMFGSRRWMAKLEAMRASSAAS
jgi:uncharacterized protein DUF2442